MELAVATSSGWSAAGGPWVEPADAMKKVVWSESVVSGGGIAEVVLPPLPEVPGLYQDCPRWGAASRRTSATRRTGACSRSPPTRRARRCEPRRRPRLGADRRLVVPDRRIVRPHALAAAGPRRVVDGVDRAGVRRARHRPLGRRRAAWAARVRRGAAAASAVLQASDDGVAYRDVAELPADAVPARTVAFPPSRRAGSGWCCRGRARPTRCRRVADGVRRRPVLRTVDTFEVSEFALRAGGRVHRAEAKAGFAAAPDYFALPTDPRVDDGSDRPGHRRRRHRPWSHDGVLRWDAPAGRLDRPALRRVAHRADERSRAAGGDRPRGRQARRGAGARRTSTRTSAGSRPATATARTVRSPLRRPAQRQHRVRPAELAPRRSASTSPSGAATTRAVAARARRIRRRGRARQSDRFLYDYRRTLAELLAERVLRHARGGGASRAAWPTTPRRSRTTARSSATTSPCARTPTCRWARCGCSTPAARPAADVRRRPEGRVVRRARATAKPFTGAESMTAFHRPWSYTPRRLKHVADLELALGVTRFCIHTSPHQPTPLPPPGIALAPFLGQAFIRHEPWAGPRRTVDRLPRPLLVRC